MLDVATTPTAAREASWVAARKNAGSIPNVLLQAGSELDSGKYRILRLLGEGGMGAVFEAEHTRSLKRVAIKCLHPSRRGDEPDMERMVREAQASARVRHRNVVEVFDVGRDGPIVFLVMEYLEGETLREALDRGDLPAHAAISLLLQAMQGVAAAHKQGVIHRDIKPENIFLARELDEPAPVVKVLDFGISKLDASEEQKQLTATGVPVGTPFYMSLEQLKGQKDVDARADVYAFGAVLYEALTGRRPYEADTMTALCCKVLEGPPPSAKEIRPELPTSLSRLIMWALATDRGARVATVKQLMVELEPFSTLRGMRAELASSDGEDSEHPALPNTGPAARVAAAQESAASLAASPLGGQTHASWARKLLLTLAALALAAVLTLYLRSDAQNGSTGSPEQLVSLPGETAASSTAPAPAGPIAVEPPALPFAPVEPVEPAPTPERVQETDPVKVAPVRTRLTRDVRDAGRASTGAEPAAPAAASLAVARTRAELERLREQLVKCGDLRTRWLRDKCRDDHKREIAEYEEQRELLESMSDR